MGRTPTTKRTIENNKKAITIAETEALGRRSVISIPEDFKMEEQVTLVAFL